MDIYNLKFLLKVTVRDTSPFFYRLIYKPASKFLWFKTDEYFLDKETGCKYSRKQIEEHYFIIMNCVYKKPKVILTFVNEEERWKKFETYQEAMVWEKELANLSEGAQLVID